MRQLVKGFCVLIVIILPKVSVSQAAPERGSVILSHLSADYGQASDEFVVLFNKTGNALDLAGYSLRYFTASGALGSAGRTFTGSTVIPPFGHLMVASSDTVHVGSISVLSDGHFTSGMATTGGQLVLRSSDEPDSIVFACAWGSITQYVAAMTDAAVWNGDGMLKLVWTDTAYDRTSYNRDNTQYVHVSADSIRDIPSQNGAVSPENSFAWTISLTLSQDDNSDSGLTIGSAEGASDGFDVLYDEPLPPSPPGSLLRAGIYRPDLGLPTGNHLLRDIRSLHTLSDTTYQWYIDVWAEATDIPLEIILDVSDVPSRLPVQLRRMGTGELSERSQDSVRLIMMPPTIGPYRFLVLVGDTTPPAMMFVRPEADTVLVAGSQVSVDWTVAEASGLDSLSLSFMNTVTGVTYAITDTITVSSYIWQLPRRLLTDSSVFRIFARDSMGNQHIVISPNIRVVPDTAKLTLDPGWHSFSLPLEPVGSHILSSAEDSLFVFTYLPGEGYVRADSLIPGEGYFIGVLATHRLVLPGITVMDSVSRSLSSGFSLISSPSGSPMARGDLLFGVEGTWHTYASAVSSGLIANGFFGYDHETGLYYSADSLMPWNAYWVPVLAPTVSIRFVGAVQEAPLRVVGTIPGWEIDIHAVTDDMTDSLFSIGVHPDASDGFDAPFDIPAPPLPPDDPLLSVYAERTSWNVPTGDRFLRDIRRGGIDQTWAFTVRTNGTASVILRWGMTRGSTPQGLMIRDVSKGGEVWMPFSDRWLYAYTGSGRRDFEIRMSVTDVAHGKADVPHDFIVSKNYPNPFNGRTSVTVAIPWTGNLEVRIYDLLGKEVYFSSEGTYEPGRYLWSWTADMSSGMYFGEATIFSPTTGRREVRHWRMILMK